MTTTTTSNSNGNNNTDDESMRKPSMEEWKAWIDEAFESMHYMNIIAFKYCSSPLANYDC